MSDILRLSGKYTKTFSIKVYYDSDGMEVQAVEFPASFERLDGLSQADLLKDVVGELEKFGGDSFEDFVDDVKIDHATRKERNKKVKLKAVE
tara:strand:+ start:57 stop:332 length:276 start_codon:yes stop_codon:yes gene_type:complete